MIKIDRTGGSTRLPKVGARQPQATCHFAGLLFFLPLPDLQEVSAPRLGCEFTRAWLAGRGEADLVTVSVQFVDAEHDFFSVRSGIHLLWLFRRVELDRPLLASGVLCRLGEDESVILDDDAGVLHLVLGQRFTIFHRGDQLPSALQPVQVLLGCWVLRVISCQRHTDRRDDQELRLRSDS